MRKLTQICLAVVIVLMLPFFLVLRLFGWRPRGQTGMQSLFPREAGGYALVSAEESDAHPYPYIYVNDDGGARELRKTEREHLEAPFLGADGGRPYVKWRYGQRNGWGDLGGFLRRTKLPRGIPVDTAPEDEPERDAKTETIRRAREMGCDIIENGNGSYTIVPSKMFRSDL
jgi:hypothetical protein